MEDFFFFLKEKNLRIFGFISNAFSLPNGFSFNSRVSAKEKSMSVKFCQEIICFWPAFCLFEPTISNGNWNLAKEDTILWFPLGSKVAEIDQLS